MPNKIKTPPKKVVSPIRKSQRKSAGKSQILETVKHGWITEPPSKEDKYLIREYFEQEFLNPKCEDND